MGFRDAEWAYSLNLPMAVKVVLVAVCHVTDDETHETFRGQERIAQMLGASVEKVRVALTSLERLGVLTRQRRNGFHGYRTSDLITVNVGAYREGDSPQDSPTRRISHQENSGVGDVPTPRILVSYPKNLGSPTPRILGAEEIIQIDHSVDQSVLTPPTPSAVELIPISDLIAEVDSPPKRDELIAANLFDQFWAAYPRKVAKPAARKVWSKAIRAHPADQIIAAAIRYDADPNREDQFTKHPATWLNNEGWNDPPLPQRSRPPTRNDHNRAFVAEIAAAEAQQLFARKELSA